MKFLVNLAGPATNAVFRLASGTALASVLATASFGQTTDATVAAADTTLAAAGTDGREIISEIVVTARHRVESEQNVPIAISTISSAQLEAQGATTVKQVLQQLPSLNIQGFSGRNQTITIRGLGTNAGGTNDGLEQGVGLYIDGVYRPRTGTVITDLMETESIQLLRGPQGTLFGKNTVAGAIDITTQEPLFKPEARAELTYGNYNQFRGYLSYNAPITDNLAIRLSYLHSQRDGLIYDTKYQQDWDDLNNNAGRIDLLYKPSESFKFRLIGDWSNQVGRVGFNSITEVLPTTLANGTEVRGFYRRAADVGYVPIPIDPFARRVDLDSPQDDKMPSWGVQGRADWDIGALTLTSITAYRNWKWVPHYDGDQIGANVSVVGVVDTDQQQFSQELRATSNSTGAIDYTSGLYFFWQEADDNQISQYGRDASVWLRTPNTPTAAVSTLPSAALDGLVAFSHVVPQTYSYAAYGNVTWHVTPAFRLTGGLRLTYEHKTGLYDATGGGPVASLSSFAVSLQPTIAALRASLAPTGSYEASRDTTNVSGTFIAAYDFSPDVHGYISYSHGYKSPGINLVALSNGVDIFVKPESVDNYEIGVKNRLFDGRAEVNLSLFWTDDRNYQANFVNYSVTPIVSYITNVGNVRSRGIELDVRATPIQGLTVGLAGTYNDAKYLSYRNAPAQYLNSYLGYIDLSGRPASGASRYSATANVEYAKPLNTIELYIGGDVSYRSSFYAAVNLDPFSRIPSYTLFGLHAGVRDPDERWDVSFWVRNLFNEDYYSTKSVSATYGVAMGGLGEPRMFGVTLRGKI